MTDSEFPDLCKYLISSQRGRRERAERTNERRRPANERTNEQNETSEQETAEPRKRARRRDENENENHERTKKRTRDDGGSDKACTQTKTFVTFALLGVIPFTSKGSHRMHALMGTKEIRQLLKRERSKAFYFSVRFEVGKNLTHT